MYNTAGGLPTEYFDVGIPDGSGTTSPRFYYDSREGRCIQFSVCLFLLSSTFFFSCCEHGKKDHR